MRLIITFTIAFITSYLCFSRNNKQIEFVGTLAIKNGEVLSYKLIFNQQVNNEISGYTITDFYGKKKTRTSITGIYDTINNIISFNETQNIVKRKDLADSNFCFVSAKKLKTRTVRGYKIISGQFKATYPSGDLCADGMIYLIESILVEKIKSMPDIKPISKDSILDKKINKDSITVLRANQTTIVEQESNEVTIEIWDGSVPDNDMIRIFYNDKTFRENITLTSNKVILQLPSNEKNYKLKFVALNEGYSGLNTLNFLIKNSQGEKKIESILRKGEFFEIDFINPKNIN